MAAALAACAAPAAAGGGDPGSARAGVRFQHHPYVPGRVNTPVVVFHFDDGRRRGTARSTEFGTAAQGTPHSPRFETAQSGELRVTATLLEPAGDTLAVGGLTLPLRPDWEWGVVAAVNRRSTILGTPGIDPRSFRDYWVLRGQERAEDPLALYLTYGGTSISRPTPR